MSTPFMEDNDQTRARREHLDRIRELVGNAYPNKFRRSNVTRSPTGEDTIHALADTATIKRLVGDEAFAAAFDALHNKLQAGERPTADDIEPLNAALNRIDVRVSGRLAVPPRVMGKAAFVHLSDGVSRMQIYVRRDDARALSPDGSEVDGWQLFQLLDHGDFIGVAGFLFVTKTGELSVHVREFEFLSKALLPMPDKMHGISDPEIRQRQRYADLIAASLKVEKDGDPPEGREHEQLNTRQVFERRSQLIREMRRHLDDHGYIEVETPMLTPIASGAAARPFKTHHNALDIDLYARIAPELYLKRLLVGGFERVYELNRNFRNEGIDRSHNPEFTMLEFYTAYKDVNWMMDFCEEMIRTAVEKVIGGTTIRFGERELDFGRRFERLTMKDAISAFWPDEWRELGGERFDIEWLDDPRRGQILYQFSLTIKSQPVDERSNPANVQRFYEFATQAVERQTPPLREPRATQVARNIERIFGNVAEEEITQPTFITDFPKPISPLSKASPDDPSIAERFELYAVGMECANGFSELNDPVEQYERFLEQTQQREGGDDEAMQMDVDYVRALAYGMPPAAGIGIGIDRLVMLLTNRRSIRDVILFPHMRPQRQAEEADGETQGE